MSFVTRHSSFVLIAGPGVYSFTHKSIAEYLVAEAVFQGVQRDAAGARLFRDQDKHRRKLAICATKTVVNR